MNWLCNSPREFKGQIIEKMKFPCEKKNKKIALKKIESCFRKLTFLANAVGGLQQGSSYKGRAALNKEAESRFSRMGNTFGKC